MSPQPTAPASATLAPSVELVPVLAQPELVHPAPASTPTPSVELVPAPAQPELVHPAPASTPTPSVELVPAPAQPELVHPAPASTPIPSVELVPVPAQPELVHPARASAPTPTPSVELVPVPAQPELVHPARASAPTPTPSVELVPVPAQPELVHPARASAPTPHLLQHLQLSLFLCQHSLNWYTLLVHLHLLRHLQLSLVLHVHPAAESLEDLLQVCKFPNSSWSNHTIKETPLQSMKMCKLSSVPSTSTQPLVVVCCLTVHQNLSWTAHVYGNEIKRATTCLSSIPVYLDTKSMPQLISLLDRVSVCPGNPDSHFLAMADARKGKFPTAAIDESIPVIINGKTHSRTVRTNSCQIVVAVSDTRCSSCKSYRNQLRATYSRWLKKSPTLRNVQIISTLILHRRKSIQNRATNAENELKQLKARIASSAEKNGISVDSYLHADLKEIIAENQQSIYDQFPEGSFKRLFWDQQAQAASLADTRQMRWHPVMVRWCLNLKLISSGAYHALRSSGFIQLPTERTLNDYTHYIKSRPGFQKEVEE